MKIAKYLSIMALGALVFTACSQDFNDQFPGLGEKTEITNVQSFEYTLTDADYEIFAANGISSRKIVSDADLSARLVAAGSAKGFASPEEAHTLLPYYFAWTGGNFFTLSNDSAIKVTYNAFVSTDGLSVGEVKEYTLSAADYIAAWGSEEDYLEALTPSTLGKLASAVSTEGLEDGDYVAVTYKYAATEPVFSTPEPEEEDKPVYRPVTTPAAAGGKYILVAERDGKYYAFTALAESYNYGYAQRTEVSVANGVIDAETVPETIVLDIEQVSNGNYTIKDYMNRYYYLSGTYASFNVSTTLGDAGFTYTFTNDDGKARFTNENGRWIQYGQGTYTTWGAYPTQEGTTPVLYQLDEGGASGYQAVTSIAGDDGKYLLVAEKDGVNYAFTALDASKTYGYPAGTQVDVQKGVIAEDSVSETLVLSIKSAAGGKYTIQDYLGRYYYLSGTYASFNVSAEFKDDPGYTYTFTNDGGKALFTNANGRWIQHGQGTYTTWGVYDSQQGGNPTLYRLGGASAASLSISKSAVVPTSPTENKYAIFKYEGGKLTEADFAVLQPSDYAAMGLNYGNVTDGTQAKYLPRFLSVNYPYAAVDDVKYVAYRKYVNGANEWAVEPYAFDGTAWGRNDLSYTDQFVRTGNKWVYNPSVVIWLEPKRNDTFIMAYYQAVTDWVWANVDVPMGCANKGEGFVTSYGNNDYYTGCSAYYNNVDVRAGSAANQYGGESYQGSELVAAGVAFAGDGYTALLAVSEAAVQDLMIKRLQFVMGKALGVMHPDAAPVDGMDVTYTVNVGIYFGTTVSTCTHSLIYKVTGRGQFEFVEMLEL